MSRRSHIPASPLFWPSVAEADRQQAWHDLRGWVDDYARRFAVHTRTIPACWYRHNPMVEALAALRDHEQASYEFSTAKTTAVEFIRASRDVGIVLRELAGRCGCSAGHHRPDASRAAVDEGDWLDFVGADTEWSDAPPDEPDASDSASQFGSAL